MASLTQAVSRPGIQDDRKKQLGANERVKLSNQMTSFIPPSYPHHTLVKMLVLLVATHLITACGMGAKTDLPAPHGDLATLEKLADAYRDMANTLTQSPVQQIPSDKRAFVEKVFSKAGYSYNATLLALAADELDPADPRQRDMAELLLFPTIGVNEIDLAKLYPGPELAAVEKLKKRF